MLSAAVFEYRQLAGNVTISGLEQVKNSGTEAIINLLEARINVLEKSMMNSLSTSIYSIIPKGSRSQAVPKRREPHRGYDMIWSA